MLLKLKSPFSGHFSMSGIPDGIKIHAVFISKTSGRVLKQYAGRTDVELWIIPNFDNSSGSVVAVSFILLLAMSAAFGTCYFVQRHHVRHGRSRAPQVQEFHGMGRRRVKEIPSLIFTRALEDNCTSRACAICLEDYKRGEKLRVLPCHHSIKALATTQWRWTNCKGEPIYKAAVMKREGDIGSAQLGLPSQKKQVISLDRTIAEPNQYHLISPTASHIHQEFHAFCVDSWLTSWRTFCPVCKRDARTSTGSPPAFESTPLLTSAASSPASTAGFMSVHSSFVSPPVPIVSTPTWSHLSSRTHSLSSTSHVVPSYKSHNNSMSENLRIGSSQRSQTSHLVSPHSYGIPLSSSLNPRYMPPYSYGNATPSSGQHSYLQHCESGASISALASAQSLPGC